MGLVASNNYGNGRITLTRSWTLGLTVVAARLVAVEGMGGDEERRRR
jgi:hypothetical protein